MNKPLYHVVRNDDYSGWGFWGGICDHIETRLGGGRVSLMTAVDRDLEFERIPHSPFVGICHEPFLTEIPDHFNVVRLAASESMKPPNCLGLFCMSRYQHAYLSSKMEVPVIAVTHPAKTPIKFWSMNDFQMCKEVWFAGFHLRNFKTIEKLKPTISKVFHLSKNSHWVPPPNENNVRVFREFLPQPEYEDMLCRKLLFTDFVDAAANNLVVECIVRNTPILVPWHAATVEYLGPDYPLFFCNAEEASWKASTDDLILKGSEYLAAIDKTKFDLDYFAQSLACKPIVDAVEASNKEFSRPKCLWF